MGLCSSFSLFKCCLDTKIAAKDQEGAYFGLGEMLIHGVHFGETVTFSLLHARMYASLSFLGALFLSVNRFVVQIAFRFEQRRAALGCIID